ncbi:hypothetical protein SODG_007313 [Sodalis praecaptivus]
MPAGKVPVSGCGAEGYTGRRTRPALRWRLSRQVTGAGLNTDSALWMPHWSDQVFFRPLAISKIKWNSCQPTSSMVASPVAIVPALMSIKSYQRSASAVRVAILITGTAARP